MRKLSISNTTLIMGRFWGLICVLGWFSACQSIVPATTPLQLNHTPSAVITLTDSTIDGGWFTFDYPNDWRVVTNIASEPLHLILVSPDDSLVIHVEDAQNDCPVQSTDTQLDECVGEEGTQLHIWGEQITELQAEFEVIFQNIVNSVTFR